MLNRFSNRFPGEPSLGDEMLAGAASLELKLIKFKGGDVSLTYEITGELLATGDIADSFCPENTNRDPARAKNMVGELLAALLDSDEGRASA